jgi:hypothetical protein
MFNAVLCALLHAGIPLRRCFVSVSVALCDSIWVIDPTASEQVRLRLFVPPMAQRQLSHTLCLPHTHSLLAGQQQLLLDAGH